MYDDAQTNYTGNDRVFAYKYNRMSNDERTLMMNMALENVTILDKKSLFYCDMFDEIVINGNTMTGYYSDSDWYGRTGWYNIKMTKIK